MNEATVKEKVYKALELLETTGDVLWFERLNSGKIKTEWGSWIQMCRPGTYDFIIIMIGKEKQLVVLFLECKASDNKEDLSKSQVEFRDKIYGRHVDIHMNTIRSREEAVNIVLGLCFNRVDAIDFMN